MFYFILLSLLIVTVCSLNLRNSTTYKNLQVDSFGDYTSIDCTPGTITNACSYRGVCGTNNTCFCNNDYITYPPNSEYGCNYKQKSGLTAFLLQFFLGGLGVAEFYLGNNDLGAGQLCLLVGGIIFSLIVACFFFCVCKSEDKLELSVMSWISLIFLSVFIWWIYDLVYIGKGWRLDGNGASISPL